VAQPASAHDVLVSAREVDPTFQLAGDAPRFIASRALSPRAALDLRERLHSRIIKQGWTVLIVDDDAYSFLLQAGLRMPDDIDASAASSESERIFRELEERLVESIDDPDEPSGNAVVDRYRVQLEEIQAVPSAEEETTGGFHFLENADAVLVLLLPVPEQLAFAAVGFGGFSEAPDEEVNRVIHAYWHARYGAVPIYAGADYLEFAVARPPTTVESVRRLTWEQYVYCSDIVEQGTQSLPALASELRKHRWFFWWD
jgi:hypothetical protein